MRSSKNPKDVAEYLSRFRKSESGTYDIGLLHEIYGPLLALVPVDCQWYAFAYHDLNVAFADDYIELAGHYRQIGFFELRRPYLLTLDEPFYRARYPDLSAASDRGYIKDLPAHYRDTGFQEGRWSSADLHCGLLCDPELKTPPSKNERLGRESPNVDKANEEELAVTDRLVVVDVGARGGIQSEWLPYVDLIRPVLFEPDPDAARSIREQYAPSVDLSVMEYALYNVSGRRTLNLTMGAGCTSLLEPDMSVVGRYEAGGGFVLRERISIACHRYDELYSENLVPRPDVIKADVQGVERQVLEGFGRLLETCLAIEIETHVYKLYHGQDLLSDLTTFLDGFDFGLVKLQPQGLFGEELVEFNAFFLKRSRSRPDGDASESKVQLIRKAWSL